ncbi:hypothetical protein [Paraferrimonas haliotis]|uniref:hypothetical protein n=1 Tax=Paraferrimonas haliotis TaxID=2013866 RepID=UPI001E6073FC|nr:hypothetical protein [Paraferrimonas haliotis]
METICRQGHRELADIEDVAILPLVAKATVISMLVKVGIVMLMGEHQHSVVMAQVGAG